MLNPLNDTGNVKLSKIVNIVAVLMQYLLAHQVPKDP